MICCIYQNDDEWLPWACGNQIGSLMVDFGRNNVVFRARKSVRLRADLESLLFDELLGFVGSALLVANVAVDNVKIWLIALAYSFKWPSIENWWSMY